MNLQRKDKDKLALAPGRFGLDHSIPHMDMPITKEIFDNLDMRSKARLHLQEMEREIRTKIIDFLKATNKKPRYIIMDENTKIKLSQLSDWASILPPSELPNPDFPTCLTFDNLHIIVVHGRGEGITIGH